MSDIKEQKEVRIALACKQQNQASNPQNSVWVEASAGTGKTQVLSDRVVRLLLDGANPAHILCLTYTKAAAAEMNNRIIKRLSQWAVMDEAELCSKLEELLATKLSNLPDADKLIAQARRLFAVLLDTPGGIKIQTIHSFCQEVLKRFPLEAGVSPYFEVMDERETADILKQIKEDILTKKISSSITKALEYLTSNSSEYTFPNILSSITTNRNLLESYFAKFDSFDEVISSVNSSLKLTPADNHDTVIAAFWKDISEDDIRYIIRSLSVGSSVSVERSQRLITILEQHNFDGLTQIFLTDKLEPNKKFFVKKSTNEYPDSLIIYERVCQNIVQILSRLRDINLRDSTIAVLTLADELLTRYQNYKTARSKMDYNDLIVKTKQLLSSSSHTEWVLYKLDGGIDHILIDEAQDTSPEQWQIIQALSKEFLAGSGSKTTNPSIFVVGDSKQSIYSFQGADIAEFASMHQYFEQSAPDFKTVNMDVSFRSTAPILDMVNAVFSSSLAAKGVSSTQQLNHIPSRIGEGGHVEIWPITYSPDDNTDDDVWYPPIERVVAQSASAILAQKIATTILGKVQSHELKADGTPLQFKDFLILVQRRNSFIDEIVRACKNIGVAVAGVDKLQLMEQIAIMDLIAAAKFALLPDDDLNLACLLKSPIFGLDDDDLMNLCFDRPDTIWQQVTSIPAYSQIASDLQNLIDLGRNSRPYEFFAHILIGLQGRKKFIARLGPECEDAIDEFVNINLSFEQGHIPSLQLFVEWMQSDDVEIKRNLEQNNLDAVRLMTVHGSKGLQAPVVILPDTVRFKSVNQEAGLLSNDEEIFYPLSKDYYNNQCTYIQEIKKSSVQEEYNRLLYVALTRAGEQLYICGYAKSNEPSEQSWYNLCRQALSQIAPIDSDTGIISYHLNSVVDAEKKQEATTASKHIATPSWLNTPAMAETPLSKPLTPSHQEEQNLPATSPLTKIDNSHLYRRGNIIHKLLQFIPNEPLEQRQEAIKTYLNTSAADLSADEQNKIAIEVLNLINSAKFAPLFAANSVAEAAIMGEVEGRIISGQIDRLVVTDDKVMIIDYKTNRPAAKSLSDVPPAYYKQLRAYRQLITKLYPDKQVETYILWTNTAQIMEIE